MSYDKEFQETLKMGDYDYRVQQAFNYIEKQKDVELFDFCASKILKNEELTEKELYNIKSLYKRDYIESCGDVDLEDYEYNKFKSYQYLLSLYPDINEYLFEKYKHLIADRMESKKEINDWLNKSKLMHGNDYDLSLTLEKPFSNNPVVKFIKWILAID